VVSSYIADIQAAACRQATFLNFVFNMNNTNLYSSGGRCAQSSSAGSAAVAYSMAYYGSQAYLDNVEFKSGPPLSDIEQGCEVPNTIQTTVCGGSQYGCKLGGLAPWTLSPRYTDAAVGVQGWTGDSSCAAGHTTSAASNLAWLQQSIVDDGTNNPTFSYPTTAMAGWLCQSVQNNNLCTGGSGQDGGQGGSPSNDCPNNSSTQGEIFYAKLTSNPNQLPQSNYSVYAVQGCSGPEGVEDGTVPAVVIKGVIQGGTAAIENDMETNCIRPAQ
jgi:hypothetical protein